ncbi:MAG: type II toxin-antitoxin system HicB family antitoxin [Candidatus Andersenbacteria bacterium]|nr:type II toxin-antitoxin system HicB family antitoxin [Candidatus Andersenbacteria bacterium]
MNNLSFSLPVSIFKEGDVFVAHTPALDISTHADTLAEAKKNFEELIGLFFEELEKKGTTDEVLESMGWQKIERNWSAPVEIEHSIETFSVPARA